MDWMTVVWFVIGLGVGSGAYTVIKRYRRKG